MVFISQLSSISIILLMILIIVNLKLCDCSGGDDNEFVFQDTSPYQNDYENEDENENENDDGYDYSNYNDNHQNYLNRLKNSLPTSGIYSNKYLNNRMTDEKVFNYYSEKTVCESNNICTSGIFKWHKSKTKSIYVGGIFPMIGGWPGGQSCLPSAIMALNEVNLNTSILPDYKINLNWFNSEVCLVFFIFVIHLNSTEQFNYWFYFYLV